MQRARSTLSVIRWFSPTNDLAQRARLPSMYFFRDYVEAGGLMSYGPNYAGLFARAGDFVDKILRGAKAVDLPVEQPTKFELIVLATLVDAYEAEHYPIDSPDPIEAIKFRMEQQG